MLLNDVASALLLIALLVVPGWAWSFLFFSKKQLSLIERLMISIVLSVVLVSVIPLALNVVFGIKINQVNSALLLLALVLLPAALVRTRAISRFRGETET